MSRREFVKRVVEVTHVARPMGRARENGPHLDDLRKFVAECDGMPGDLFVRVDKGHMGESGRYDVTLSVRQQVTEGEPDPEAVADAASA